MTRNSAPKDKLHRSQLFGIVAAAMGVCASSHAEVVNFSFDSTIFAGHPFPFSSVDSSAGLVEFGSTTETALGLPTVVNNFYTSNASVQGQFSYDTNSPVTGSGATFANYNGVDYSFTMNIPGLGATLLQKASPAVTVFNDDGSRDGVNVSSGSALTSGNVMLSNPTPATITVDLLADNDFTSNFSNIPVGVGQMLVQMTRPMQMDYQSSTLLIRDNTQTALADTSLPTALNLASYPDSIFLIQLEGGLAISVDPADYPGGASDPDYLATDAWVSANINSADLISGGNWNIVLLNGGGIIGIPGVTEVSEDPAERAGSSTTQSIVTSQIASQQPLVISSRVNSVVNSRASRGGTGFSGGPAQAGLEMGTGRSAGDDDGDGGMGAWVSYARTRMSNNLSSTEFNADVDTVLGGLDSRFGESTVLGLALGVERQRVKTDFNLGSQRVRGYTIAPYFGHVFDETFSIDASVGISNSNINQDRIQAGTNISGKQDTHRRFASMNVNALQIKGPWVLSGSAGMVWAKDKLESFTESNGLVNPEQSIELIQGRVGGEVAYSHNAWEPYVHGAAVWDFKSTPVVVAANLPQPARDQNEFQFGAGLRYFGENGLSGALEWNTVRGRDDVESDSIALTLRLDF